jgi:hypothetical protein
MDGSVLDKPSQKERERLLEAKPHLQKVKDLVLEDHTQMITATSGPTNPATSSSSSELR